MLSPEVLKVEVKETCQKLENFIRRKLEENQRSGAVVGLSGGLDSSVIVALCARSLGADKVKGLILPERDTHRRHIRDAQLVARKFNIHTHTINLRRILRKLRVYQLVPSPFFFPRSVQENYVKKRYHNLQTRLGKPPYFISLTNAEYPEFYAPVAFYRAKNRLRMLVLYLYAEKENLLVVGTLNRTEWLTGFFVKYGDGAADIMPLARLYKSQVLQIASYLEIPSEIMAKPPSPDLIPGLNDEDILGINYTTLDLILYGIEKNLPLSVIGSALSLPPERVYYFQELIKFSQIFRNSAEFP